MLLLILSELAEGGRKQSEPFKKVPEEILQPCPSGHTLQAAQKESCPLLGSKGLWREKGGQGPWGGGGHLSLVLPFREGAEGDRLGECRIKCLWRTEHSLAKPTKIGDTGGCLSDPSA